MYKIRNLVNNENVKIIDKKYFLIDNKYGIPIIDKDIRSADK